MLGYCTNVHRGYSFQDVLENIRSICKPICEQSNKTVGAGLWLSNHASLGVDVPQLRETLDECNVTVFTLNGFPFGDFHSEFVLHDVYEPSWAHPDRLDYTLRLANILSEITDNDEVGISTLPLGWNASSFTNKEAARLLHQCVSQLEELENNSGVCVHLDIETEPGCRLQRSEELATFINTYFGDDEKTRRYLRVCHDTCHGAVMHECVEESIENYRQAGLAIGKVQLSSAIEVDFTTSSNESCIEDLKLISEPKYLHQTTVLDEDCLLFYENLEDVPLNHPNGLWRVHFHVPIHLQTVGCLGTTQAELLNAIPALQQVGVTEWEVETYTWNVVPAPLRDGELVDSISKELRWAENQLDS